MYDFDLQYGAWTAVQKAIDTGKLVKPKACSACSNVRPLEFHHNGDYRDALCGIWLCRSCHRKEHSKLKRMEAHKHDNIV